MTDTEIGETTAEALIEHDDAEVTALVIDAHVEESSEEDRSPLPVREMLERQLVAGHSLSGQLLDTATDLGVALVEAPARVIAEVRDGATLPDAFGETGGVLQASLVLAGDRARATVGKYIGGQATLPNAVIVGTAEVAASVVRAQGSLAASAVDAAFTVATVAAQGGDVRDAFEREWSELTATATSARDNVSQTFGNARQGVRQPA